MIHLKISTMIARPIQEVFDYVSTPENNVQWQYGNLATARLSKGIGTTGTFFRTFGHLLGHRNLGTFEVTQFEPNREYGFKSLSGSLHLQTLYAFAATEGGTKITVSTHCYAIQLFRMEERLLGRKIKKQLIENLKLLKDLLEETVCCMEAYPLAG